MSADHVHLKLTTLETDAANAAPAPLDAEPPVDASPVDGVHDFMVSIDDDDETNKENDHEEDIPQESPPEESDVVANEIIQKSKPTTDLELALTAALERKDVHIQRLMDEINKLRAFISKRKQTYKRKRKDDGAPTRALSAYNMFIKERFAELAKQNEDALKSADADAALKRVPPANLVTKTGNEWKDLPAEVKAKYEEKAKVDRKRYEEEMSLYQPPDKQTNRKRNKTGYNMFFSAHVLRLKASENGVPSERGSVARLVGTAWKSLSADEKQYYEREADKHNGMTPTKEEVEEEEEDDTTKRIHQQQMEQHYHMHPGAQHGVEMHTFMPPPPPMHMQPHPHHQPDPRHYHHPYPPHMYPPQPPYPHYDYSQHHQRNQSRSTGGYGHNQGYSGSRHGHGYDATL